MWVGFHIFGFVDLVQQILFSRFCSVNFPQSIFFSSLGLEGSGSQTLGDLVQWILYSIPGFINSIQ